MSRRGVRAALCIVGLLCLLVPLGRDGGLVVRAEQSDDRDEAADRASCLETVGSWSEAQLHQLSSLPPESALDRVKLRDLLFFLHIPRTGGRTFDQCFLKHLFAYDQRCPRSYDKLRIDRSQPGCRLISTHDDYSLLDNLPHGVTSVITSLREPVDRVLSSYEFSIEVAARALRKAARKQIPKRSARPVKSNNKFMNTLDIWPWRYLVPTMEKDLFGRRDGRRASEMNGTGLSVDDSYDAAVLAMPFYEFIGHPVAHELVHNGATFQVAGLTNTSYSENAGAIRHCIVRFPHLGKLVVEVAKARLDRMLYVGLTERQNESAVFFAKVLGDQISMEVFMKGVLSQGKLAQSKTIAGPNPPRLQSNFTSLETFTEEEVIEAMLESYRLCVANLRRAQEDRRSMSLDLIKPIKFSRERRKLIPDSVMQKVSALNSLDAELYTHAQGLFQQQQKLLEFGSFHFMKDPKMRSEDNHLPQDGLKPNYELILSAKVGTDLLACLLGLFFFVTVCYIVKSRRGARVKET